MVDQTTNDPQFGKVIPLEPDIRIHFALGVDGVIKDNPKGNGKLLLPPEELNALISRVLENRHYLSFLTNNPNANVEETLKNIGLSEDEISKIVISTTGYAIKMSKNHNAHWAKEEHGIANSGIPTVLIDDTKGAVIESLGGDKLIPVIPVIVCHGSGMFGVGRSYDRSHFEVIKDMLDNPSGIQQIAENHAKKKGYYKDICEATNNKTSGGTGIKKYLNKEGPDIQTRVRSK